MQYKENLNYYDKLIEKFSEIERKGKSTPYTSINGHMFSFLSKEGKMGLRMAKKDRELFLAEHKTELIIQHGRTMKEYVLVPKSLLQKTEKLYIYLQKSFHYVSNLKPKPTKKKK